MPQADSVANAWKEKNSPNSVHSGDTIRAPQKFKTPANGNIFINRSVQHVLGITYVKLVLDVLRFSSTSRNFGHQATVTGCKMYVRKAVLFNSITTLEKM
jgi:hypothetical protein